MRGQRKKSFGKRGDLGGGVWSDYMMNAPVLVHTEMTGGWHVDVDMKGAKWGEMHDDHSGRGTAGLFLERRACTSHVTVTSDGGREEDKPEIKKGDASERSWNDEKKAKLFAQVVKQPAQGQKRCHYVLPSNFFRAEIVFAKAQDKFQGKSDSGKREGQSVHGPRQPIISCGGH